MLHNTERDSEQFYNLQFYNLIWVNGKVLIFSFNRQTLFRALVTGLLPGALVAASVQQLLTAAWSSLHIPYTPQRRLYKPAPSFPFIFSFLRDNSKVLLPVESD